MSNNPVSRARLFGSAAIVIATLCAISASVLSIGPPGLTWAAIIATIAIGYAIISAVISLLNPDAADAAWDEQNSAVHRDSLIFGFWAVLAVFILFLALSLTDRMDPAMAFYWLGPVLGAVPPAYYVVAVLRGRAE
ncbi:hypothetical protein SLH49_02220 [Cognatiyoonia sp. IB215446]|uniref:hypothetical protein n=1 Tax=Cognatiyoonia sp. IB215446 TaxID=3097355 RepID=UPI002A153D25|nr:hypothetical protein [Cognatiyoonia sp. IB215446]MDX8346790.1 hypothetical protein [Cognatiyoonia sp. IB215446]